MAGDSWTGDFNLEMNGWWEDIICLDTFVHLICTDLSMAPTFLCSAAAKRFGSFLVIISHVFNVYILFLVFTCLAAPYLGPATNSCTKQWGQFSSSHSESAIPYNRPQVGNA
jgi:hypothetical protein